MNYLNETKYSEETKQTFDKSMNSDVNTCCGGANMNMEMGQSCCGCGVMPIYECPQERVCHRYICYNVPHIIPCNTRIINHHVYRHTYQPAYTCCEENVCENVYDRCC